MALKNKKTSSHIQTRAMLEKAQFLIQLQAFFEAELFGSDLNRPI